MRRWFISDLHFGHKNALKYNSRNFANTVEMDEHAIKIWNKHIGKKDTTYIIGDFSFHKFEETKAIVAKLNGEKILILGNHDKYRGYTIKDWLEMGFKDVRDEELIKLSNAKTILLKHYPYAYSLWQIIKVFFSFKKEHYRPYHAFFPVDKGLWHIHGHWHGGPKVHGRQINVNVDSWAFKPVGEGEIVKIINEAEKNVFKFWIKKIYFYGKNLISAKS